MNYDNELTDRIADLLKGKRGITTKKMFGGLCFLHYGNMLCGTLKTKLVARVGPEQYDKALKLTYARPMDFTGKPIRGMVYVVPEGIKTKAALSRWIDRCFNFACTLPKKK